MTDIANARPTFRVDLAQTALPFDALSSVAWTDLGDTVDRFTLKRGKSHERKATEQATGTAVLDNVDRRFDPTYTGGIYGSNLTKPRRRIRIPMTWGTARTITGATNATPIVVTSNAHGFANGDLIEQTGVGGNLAANGVFAVAGVTANTYQLTNVYTGANVAGSGAYTSGGTAKSMYWRAHMYIADFPNRWQGPNDAVSAVELFDAFALFDDIPLPGSAWELVVAQDDPSFWFKPGSGAVAYDVSGNNRHGTYQGRPGFEDGIIPAYDGAGFAPNRLDTPDARASFPYKNLITGYPFTIETVLRLGSDGTSNRMVLGATSAPGGFPAGSQFLQLGTSIVLPGAIEGKLSDKLGSFSSSVRSAAAIDDGDIHHVVWVATAANNMQMWVDGVDVSGATTTTSAFPNDLSVGYAVGNYPAIAYGDFSFATQDGDALGDVVIYDGVSLSSTRIAAHAEAALTGWAGDFSGARLARLLDWIGWPAADRDIDTGKTTLPAGMLPGTLLPYIQAVETAEGGLTYMGRNGKFTHRHRHRALTAPGNVSQFTFGDDTGSGEIAYDPPVIWGGSEADHITRASGNRMGGPVQTVISSEEATAGVIRSLNPPLSNLQVQTDEEAKDRLTYEVLRYEDPLSRVRSVSVRPQEDSTVTWPKLLAVADGASVTFTANPPGGGAEYSQQSFLESTAESWDGKDVVFTYGLSPADTTVTYAQFGTAQFGTAIFGY